MTKHVEFVGRGAWIRHFKTGIDIYVSEHRKARRGTNRLRHSSHRFPDSGVVAYRDPTIDKFDVRSGVRNQIRKLQ